jgi:hypothetical protein
MRPNSKGEMKHWLINVNTGQDHKCMSWSKQGGRDAIIPSSGYPLGELEKIKESSRKKHELYLTALATLFRSPYDEYGNLKSQQQEKPKPKLELKSGTTQNRL